MPVAITKRIFLIFGDTIIMVPSQYLAADGKGNEIKMRIHGALEVEGDEYAIMSYSDSSASEFEIMKIERGKGDDVSYSAVEDEELYDDLSNAAQQHLESIGVF